MGALSWFGKFVVVPAAAAALGYSVIGPHFAGKPPRILDRVLHLKPAPAQTTQPVPSSPDDAPNAPKVSVGVHPVGAVESERATTETTPPAPTEDEPPKPRRKRRRRHRRTADPESATPADPAPSGPDPASTVGP